MAVFIVVLSVTSHYTIMSIHSQTKLLRSIFFLTKHICTLISHVVSCSIQNKNNKITCEKLLFIHFRILWLLVPFLRAKFLLLMWRCPSPALSIDMSINWSVAWVVNRLPKRWAEQIRLHWVNPTGVLWRENVTSHYALCSDLVRPIYSKKEMHAVARDILNRCRVYIFIYNHSISYNMGEVRWVP